MTTQKIPQIPVQPRERTGGRYSARLRQAGRLPAVIYGHKQAPVHVSVDYRQVRDLLRTKTHLLEVVLDEKPQPVLVKDIQWDHLGSDILHLDLTRVDLTERVTVRVELVLTGEAEGLKEEGAILEHPLSHVQIECLATQIPEKLTLDVTNLKVGEVMTAKDLHLPAGITTTLDPNTALATISVIAEEVVEAPVGEAVVGEPEVIGKKAEEGEEGEGAAPAAPGAKPAAGAPAAGGKKEAAPKKEDKK
jgi:large subunit ribosomal protein L25